MKIEEILYQTPEMTEEKLLRIIDENKILLKRNLLNKLSYYKEYCNTGIIDGDIPKDISIEAISILKEWDLIQDKKSYLSKSERDKILALVSSSLIMMTRGGESTD